MYYNINPRLNFYKFTRKPNQSIIKFYLEFKRPLYYFGEKLVKIYMKLMLQMNIFSYSKIPKGPKIIVANHPTTSDPFILTTITNGQGAILIKGILFDIPIFGRYLRWAGHIPVIQDRKREAFESALRLLKTGITVIVFIEGDTSKFIHQLRKPKTGAIRLALASGLPIFPVGIGVKRSNIKSIRSVIKGVQEWGKWYFKGPYALTIGNPISIKGNIKNKSQVEKLSSWLAGKILQLEKESTGRLESQGDF